MPEARYDTANTQIQPGQRFREIVVFLLLAFALWPILSVMFVGAYGFMIWFYQMIAGPPGPPTVGH